MIDGDGIVGWKYVGLSLKYPDATTIAHEVAKLSR